MGLPFGFKYFRNMALYNEDLKDLYLKDYGEDLENHFDQIDKINYGMRIFCLDCSIFAMCEGRLWRGCPNRAEALKIIREES